MGQHASPACEFVAAGRVVASFLDLAKIDGPSGKERDVADAVEARLSALGFSVQFDDAHRNTGGDCGNLISWWDGTNPTARPIFFSTHLDTVLPTAGLRPVIKDGVISSDGTTILGADDRAALAVYLEGIRAVQESGVACGPVELILTVSEQTGLWGARYLNYSLVRSRSGFVFDSSGDIGQIIIKGPYSTRVLWTIDGRPAHLGLAPEEGISAILIAADALREMRLGRVDTETVANVGLIHGGKLPSIIPDMVEVAGEARSFSADGLDRQLRHMTDAVQAAAVHRGGRAHVRLQPKYFGFDLPVESDHVQVAVRAARRIGATPYFSDTLGGADTNVFIEHGLECLTLGNGFRKIHSFEEHISIANLVAGARYVTALIEEFSAREQDRR